MERLTLNRRPKTGDKTACLPAGDGLPVWTTIPLDVKLPMMQNPKGSVVLYTTKLGDPKHRSKQEYDFDLRDPYGQYICNEYQPLHDPHLKSHFNSAMMRRHLIRKGFISEDGKVLCSLKEFNQYRQYLRHIFFLEIAHDRKQQLVTKHQQEQHQRSADISKKISQGSVVRKRLQHQRERQLSKLKKDIATKTERLEKRLQEIREEMAKRERKQRQEAERRQMAVHRNQQEAEQRNLLLRKRWRQRERMRVHLMEDRESERRLRIEMKCLSKWRARKKAQQEMLSRDELILKQEEEERTRNIARRNLLISRQRNLIERNIEKLKQQSREEKQKRDEIYTKKFEEKLTAGWPKKKEKRKSHQTRTLQSTWKLADVLNRMELATDHPQSVGSPVVTSLLVSDEGPDVTQSKSEDTLIREKAREIVQGVIQKVQTEIYPALIRDTTKDGETMTGVENVEEDEEDFEVPAVHSRSVRFSNEEEEISPKVPEVEIHFLDQVNDSMQFKPVAEHILTPCASQLEIQKLEAEAILGSPEVGDKTNSVSFVETLLLRLLDDLNSGRLSKEDIMKLATYSMDIIQSTEAETLKDDVIAEETDGEGPYLATSSSSVIAMKMVDFTLGKILSDIEQGNVHHDDLASLTVSLLESSDIGESSASLSVSDADLDAYIEDTIRAASASAMDPREDSPICDALLDEFMITTLKNLINDLDDEVLTKGQIESLAMSIQQETKKVFPDDSDTDIQTAEDIQNVLQSVLGKLKTRGMNMQALYQIVFAIVYSYNMLKSPPTPCFEKKVTDLMKDILYTVEQQVASGLLSDVNINIIHEANKRISNTKLDVGKIEKLSPSIISVVSKPEVVCKTSSSEIARSIVEDALVKAQQRLKANESDPKLIEGVQNVAESIIMNIQGDIDESNTSLDTLTGIFLGILEQVKAILDESGEVGGVQGDDIASLIDHIKARSIQAEEISSMAESVVRILKSPVKSESSFAADVVTKNILLKIKDDLTERSLEDDIVNEIVRTLKTCCKAAVAHDSKSPALLQSLASFLKTVLGQVTYKVECGELDERDIAELSRALKSKIDKASTFAEADVSAYPSEDTALEKTLQEQSHSEQHIETQEKHLDTGISASTNSDLKTILDHLFNILDELELGEVEEETAQTLGKRLMECGKKLLSSCPGDSPGKTASGTDRLADDVVEEVIRTLQLEIDSGILTKDSLKELTKAIISTTSDSDIADEIINHTMRGIQRDIEKGYDVGKLTSYPTLDHSPSASTIASHVVMQTIDIIQKEILRKGINKTVINSIASSVMSMMTNESFDIKNLQSEFQNVRKTVSKITECLKEDSISRADAEKIFCVILENYKKCFAGTDNLEEISEDRLSEDDILLVDELVSETLKNIERSVVKGRIQGTQYSIPSLPHSDDSSVIAEKAIEVCLDNIRNDLNGADTMSYTKPAIVDFILDIVTKLKQELLDGTVSDLSMAHFFQTISNDNSDLKTLESNAVHNLDNVISDIRKNRSDSVYVRRILETYLLQDQDSSGIFGDPLKAIESILINVSSEILTKFVKATLQNILIEMREGNGSLVEKAPSVYVLQSATSIIAENVIQEVISRIKEDMSKSVHHSHGTVNRKELEIAASALACESPQRESRHMVVKKESVSGKSQNSTSTVFSKEVENIVLETLHNIISNMRLEQSLNMHKEQRGSDDGESNMSQDIQDFVLQMLQNIVVDQQDRRFHPNLLMNKDTERESSLEHLSNQVKEASSYVNDVLQTVIHDFKEELARKSSSIGASAKPDEANVDIETVIITSLQNALSTGSLSNDAFSLDQNQERDVKRILIESINATISYIKENKFNSSELLSLYNSVLRFTKGNDSLDINVKEDIESVSSEKVVDLMETLLTSVETMGLDDNTLGRIATQLATLGMESVAEERNSPSNTLSSSSVASSMISDLIQDVLARITQQLTETSMEKFKDETGSLSSHAKSKTSSKDVNYNRRLSASSCCTSVGENQDAFAGTGEFQDTKQNMKLNPNSVERKGQEFKKPLPIRHEKKLTLRATEPRSSLRKEPFPDKQKGAVVGIKHLEQGHNAEFNKVKRNEIRHASLIHSYIDTKVHKPRSSDETKSKTHKRTPDVKKSHHKERKATPAVVKHIKGTSIESSAAPKLSASTPLRTPCGSYRRHGLKMSTERQGVGKFLNNDLGSSPVPIKVPTVSDDLLELKSLCGVHKTKLRFRGGEHFHSETDSADETRCFSP